MQTEPKKYKADTVRQAFRELFSGEEGEDGEQRAYCPICENPDTSSSPSASFNPTTGLWNCQGKCEQGGTIYKLVQQLKKERGFDIRRELMKARHNDPNFKAEAQKNLEQSGKRKAGLPSDETIKDWHKKLLRNKPALSELMSQRGWTRSTIKRFQIGWDAGIKRYTIPIYDESGQIANVRKYRLNAPQPKDKMINIPGHGEARIYGLDELAENDRVVMTEGEPDRILLSQLLEDQDDIGVVTHTAGAATFRPQWGMLFKDKEVWIAYDNDDSGRRGAAKAKKAIEKFATAVYVITIPLKEPGADVTDFVHKAGHGAEDFLRLMKEAAEADPNQGQEPLATSGKPVSLLESMAEEHQNATLELIVSVAGKQAEPFTTPKRVDASCDTSKGAVCKTCPMLAYSGQMTMELRQDDEQLFRFVDTPEARRRVLLREIVGARCTDRIEYEVPEDYHVEELLVQPSVDNRRDDETQRPIRRTVYSISTHRTGVNEKLRLVGRNLPDPKTGKLRFVAWHNESVELDIDKFKLTPEIRERLKVFQPSADQMPLDKCFEIALDMADNVTHIFKRDILHVCYDLVWHSVQSFRIGGTVEEKGWLEMLVVGDTRTGKSEIAKKMIKHYNSGHLLSCEGMSFAGIVGGVQQVDGRWHLTWGAVPMNDRRLVVLDEMSGLKDRDVIEQMSSIRSSGIAQITKISSEQTSARTRLIWISNPADGSMVNDSPDVGMGAMRSVVPNAEDIARFDFVTATGQGEVPVSAMNSGYQPHYNPEYGSEECEMLIKWAWSLTRDDVMISDAAIKTASRKAEELSGRYIPDPPLLQVENSRIKILRIAAAIAARTFSVTRSGKLQVSREHVNDAVRFLDMVYDQETMGYARKSKRAIQATQKAKERKEACRSWLRQHEDTVLQTLRMVGGTTFRTRDFEEFGAMSRDESHLVIKKLLNWKMVSRKTRGDIGMRPVLLEILRELEDEEE